MKKCLRMNKVKNNNIKKLMTEKIREGTMFQMLKKD